MCVWIFPDPVHQSQTGFNPELSVGTTESVSDSLTDIGGTVCPLCNSGNNQSSPQSNRLKETVLKNILASQRP